MDSDDCNERVPQAGEFDYDGKYIVFTLPDPPDEGKQDSYKQLSLFESEE